MYWLRNFIENTCYSCFLLKQIDKILPKIGYVTRRLIGLVILLIEKKMLAKAKYKKKQNCNLASQKVRMHFK